MLIRLLLVATVLLSCSAAWADDASLAAKGHALGVAGDCRVCHTRTAGNAPFAGGFPLHAAPGTVYSANITPDRATGIGAWNADEFYRAMHDGVAPHGHYLYPAFPYAYFTKLSRADTDALFAWLKTIKPVHYKPPPNRLTFPMNIRPLMWFWNLLFLDKTPLKPDPKQSPQWNRGNVLVNGIGHCGGCHTPKNLLFADESGASLQGGVADDWFAPDLTGTKRGGLGGWSAYDIMQFLRTGQNSHGRVAGSMQEVVKDSTSRMPQSDLEAIAVYLKSLPPSHPATPKPPSSGAMQNGHSIYVQRCAVCHDEPPVNGRRAYPDLARNTLLQGEKPDTVLRIVLQGAQAATTPNGPIGFSMPAFPVLTDKALADVATYIRNSWGHRAPPVSASQVHKFRETLQPGG